jgi:hypothetical protein
MPKVQLYVKFETENLSKIYIDNVDDFSWGLKVKCGNCHTESDRIVFLQANEQVEQEGSRGTTNLLYKCPFCARSGSIDVDPKSYQPYTAENTFAPLITFECRKGIEIVSWEPTSAQGFFAEGSTGSTFNVDFSEGIEWSDYDQDAECSVGIYKVESEFRRA